MSPLLSVQAADGRTLAVETAGDSDGVPVLVQMGTPNSRHLYPPNVADAQSRGVRLISYDRPGYGGSSARPGHAIADCASDVREICAALAIERVAIWGISGGGPYALACAALLPDLVVAVAALASVAPYGAPGLDFFDGMGQGNVDDIQLLLGDRDAARLKLERDREQLLAVSGSDLVGVLGSLLSPADAAVLDGPMAEYLAHVDHEGLAGGAEGWWDEGIAHVSPWGFELSEISVPVLLLHGLQDRFVPIEHGRWLAASVPGVESRLLDSDGHLTLLERRVGEVHDWLLDRMSLAVGMAGSEQ